MILKLIFWFCIFFILYTYIGYPVLIWIFSWIIPRPVKKGPFEPNVTLLITAYNEEDVIKDKIENSLGLDYPKEKLEIVIASDGSTDDTCKIVKEYLSYGVKLLEYPTHIGKFDILNITVHLTKGDIIVFSDAGSILNNSAVRELLSNFNDPQVGCVCGLYKMIPDISSMAAKGYHAYLDYDIWIKKSESRFNTILGAHGALYTIRRELFSNMPQYLVNDDFYIPMKVVSKGYRAVYEEKAIATEKINYSLKDEFRRRIRIAFGNWQQVFVLRKLLGLSHLVITWQFFSHKVLRTIMPFFLFIAFILSLFLEGTLYKAFNLSFILFILLTGIGLVFQWMKIPSKIVCAPFFFIMGNIAYMIATIRFWLGSKEIKW